MAASTNVGQEVTGWKHEHLRRYTASCPNGFRVVGGGYAGDLKPKIADPGEANDLEIVASRAIGTKSWAVDVRTNAFESNIFALNLTVYASCLRLSLARKSPK